MIKKLMILMICFTSTFAIASTSGVTPVSGSTSTATYGEQEETATTPCERGICDDHPADRALLLPPIVPVPADGLPQPGAAEAA